jgi:hypothetical protein
MRLMDFPRMLSRWKNAYLLDHSVQPAQFTGRLVAPVTMSQRPYRLAGQQAQRETKQKLHVKTV